MTKKNFYHSDIKLPSNRNFGFFFTFVFFILSFFLYFNYSSIWTYIFGLIGVVFFIVTVIKDEALLPLNIMWMKFGFLLGMIVNPLIMGVIFFGLFTPTAILMRIFGRDELKLSFKKKNSYWVYRESLAQNVSFKNQF